MLRQHQLLRVAATALLVLCIISMSVPANAQFSGRLISGSMSAEQTSSTTPQQPAQPQQTTPAQRDATRPPGTEERQPIPAPARPIPSDPTAPPGTQRPAPQTPPGTDLPPQAPATTATPQRPATTSTTEPVTDATSTDVTTSVPEPRYPSAQPRPVPPLPSLDRVGVNRGDTRPLTLNEAIRRALENNADIEVARDNVRLAESFLRSLEGIYDPVLAFTPQINNSVSPQQSTLGGSGSSGTVTTTDLSFSPSVVKNFERGGGTYEFFFNNNRRTTNSRFNNFNPVYSASMGVQFTQPLLRNRSIDASRRNIRIQRKRLEQSDADFRRRTIETIAQVQRAYWDLVFSLRDEQNQIANINLARENFRRIEASVAAGSVAPLQRAEIQTELSNRESSLLVASQLVTVAENNLKALILKDPLAPEWSAALMPTDEPTFDATPVNLETALREARTNREELRRLRLEEEVSDVDLQYFRNQTKPRIDLQTTFSSTGLAGSPVTSTDPITGQPLPTNVPANLVGGYGQTLSNLFRLDTRNVVVGVTIQLPLRNRTAQANLTTARIQREQLDASRRGQNQIIELEVRNAVQAVETARRRVLSAREARESAELQLTGERRLYEAGRSTTYFLFLRENQLVNARNLEVRAQTDYNKALADLQRATSTTLRANNVFIDSPVEQ